MMSAGTSIRRGDLLALAHLRNDGRLPHEIRRLRLYMGVMAASGNNGDCRGSAIVEMGLTVALATVSGPMECSRRLDERPDRAIVDVTVRVAPFATSDRRSSSSNDRRLLECAQQVQGALQAAMLLSQYPKSRIQIAICIVADDGGRLCAAINAATLAVMDAGIPMRDFVCACSAGYSQLPSSSTFTGTTAVHDDISNINNKNNNNNNNNSDDNDLYLVDLNRREETAITGLGSAAAVYVPVAILPQRHTVVLAQCESRVPNVAAMQGVLHAAQQGCHAVYNAMITTVREHATQRLYQQQQQQQPVSGAVRSNSTIVNAFPHS